jgi:hypothetical protein
MIQNWEKQGQIYPTRAQCPTVLKITENNREVWRIFFADRNAQGQSFIRYIDVNPENPKEILFEETNPILQYGPPGSFDHFGQMPTSIIVDMVSGGRGEAEEYPMYYLFYIGWGQRLDVPYHNSIGLAYSYDGKTFHKSYPGPIIGTSKFDPFFTGTACVVRGQNDPTLFWCYYLSSNGWESDGTKLEPTYRIKEAISGGLTRPEGMGSWECKPDTEGVVIDFNSPDEGGICNATVFYDQNQIKHMWYCYRKKFDYRTNRANTYRIGYATGYPAVLDGIKIKEKAKWVRQDNLVDLPLSESGWDEEMLAYPHVIEHKGKLYMFYNGNGFGTTGFGYATLKLDSGVGAKTAAVIC